MATIPDEGERIDTDEDDVHPLAWPVVAVRSSFINFVVALGVLLFALAVATDGPMAGILGVLGASALVYALLGELGLRAIGYK